MKRVWTDNSGSHDEWSIKDKDGRLEVRRMTADIEQGMDLPDLDDFSDDAGKSGVVEDVGVRAVKMAVVGSGQAGGKLAETFWNLGYRRVLAVNTSDQDLATLKLPAKNKYAIPGYEGTAKNIPLGKKAADEYQEEIIQRMHNAFGDGVEHVMICIGGGGGSGGGSVLTLVNAAKEYARTSQVEGPKDMKVGVMVTLPKRSEKGVAQSNALLVVQQLLAACEAKEISPLVIVDNGQVHKLMPDLSVSDFWLKANRSICGLFDIFNILAARKDGDPTFDVKEYKEVLAGGILTFGQTKIKKWDSVSDIADAVRLNLKKGLLAEGFDLSKARQAAGVLTASRDVLDSLMEKSVDMAYDSLGRLCDEKHVAVHRGCYADKRPGVYMYCLVSGLGAPDQRLQEIAHLAGLSYP